MKTTHREAVSEFVAQRTLALAGASRSGRKFGNILAKKLKAKGYKVYLIHPSAEKIGEEKCYVGVGELPEPVGGLVSAVSRPNTQKVVEDAFRAGVKRVWLQQGTDTEQALKLCEDNGAQVVHGECLLMFVEPVKFPHNVHRCIWRWLGQMPT